MAKIPQLILLVGAAVSLGACTSQQEPPLLSHAMDHSTSHIVRQVQIALRDRGYYAGVVDGYLGQDTGYGIQRFQVDHCLRAKPIVDRPLLVSLGIVND
ncbi:MAG TPA: peptidoglycan-binding domain-containing protein [Chthoniobacterales bacterium]|nr:peptidoglycan-binding domain-containing protein [Chthoniobacterales bacterium]